MSGTINTEYKKKWHYETIAYDFYKTSCHDDLGEIGCDTLINQQDFLWVNLIAIQALEKRTEMLKAENRVLRNEVNALRNVLNAFKTKL